MNKKIFDELKSYTFAKLVENERLTLQLNSEETTFVRINNSKVRQITDVDQTELTLDYLKKNKSFSYSITLAKDIDSNKAKISEAFNYIRSAIDQLPDDPYIVEPKNNGNSCNIYDGKILNEDQLLNELLGCVQNYDVAGIYAGGKIICANANHLEQDHWFETTNFYFDYSIYNSHQKAAKGLYADKVWNSEKFKTHIESTAKMMNYFAKENLELKPGKYRVYLAPGAVAELLPLASSALGFDDYKKGRSPFLDFVNKKVKFSNKLTITEDFSLGLNTKFNNLGEVAVDTLPIIQNGELVNLLVSSRSAKEYSEKSNFAQESESLKSAVVKNGDLKHNDILKRLDNGIYISNLHYLNWSDQMSARVTGMTRYACFWVENGEIVAPIKDMRFDDSFYKIWGENLDCITEESEIVMRTDSYGSRSIGGEKVPGMIINNFSLTL